MELNKIKVAMLCSYPLTKIYGGVENHVYHLVHHIAPSSEIELHIITLGANNEELKIHGIYINIIRKIGFIFLRPLEIIKLKKAILQINPDIVHIQCSKLPNSGVAAFICSRYPTILTIHGLAKNEFKFERRLNYIIGRFIAKSLEDYVLSKVPDIIVMTPYDKKFLQNSNANIHIIPNGVNSEYFEIITEEKPNRLLFVGLISPRKGLIDLLKAIKIIVKKIPEVKLDIVGGVVSKEYFNTLKDYIKTNLLEKNINFTGYLSEHELKKKYGEAALFVFPSYEESQGIVLVEAMACGKPVVASNIGGIPFVVENGKTGLLFECGNVKELAEKIFILLNDKELRENMSKAGRERAKIFSWTNIAGRTVEIYKEIYSTNISYCYSVTE